MFAIVIVDHTAPADAIEAHVEKYRAYLQSLREQGMLVASGPFVPRTGGAFVLRVQTEEEARDILKSEPYRLHGIARHEVRFWTPTGDGAAFARTRALEGKVALVTGASSGIGEATSSALSREGARLALAARRIERLETLGQRLRETQHTEAAVFRADLGQEKDARSLVDQVVAGFGRLDIVVNSAGVMLLSPIAEATADEWRRMIDLNLVGVMHVTQAAVAAMRKSGGGHIVNVASLAGRIANPNASAYAATKFGIVGFSESVRREVYKDNIRVTVIEPGVVATELGERVSNAAMKEALRQRVATMDPLQANDIAAAVLYAVSQPARVNVNEILVRPTGQER
jgi:NADP-dependent 3-hydroxy acid dehydrogenase YdfG/uncharacterized protein YciI